MEANTMNTSTKATMNSLIYDDVTSRLEELEISTYHFDVGSGLIWCGDEQGGLYGAAHIGEVDIALYHVESTTTTLQDAFETFHDMVTFRDIPPPDDD